jgi:potassium-transporting ATPase potassium-binding subunit
MTTNAIFQVLVFFVVLLALAKPLGWYMARVYEGKPCGLDRLLGPVARALYRLCGVRPADEMDWKRYGVAMLLFNAVGLFFLYGLQRLQGLLPLNPANLGAVAPDLAFNTAVSFTTNTNWQAYSGETTLSYLTQMLGLTVQNFVSAATGMAVLVALIRGLSRATWSAAPSTFFSLWLCCYPFSWCLRVSSRPSAHIRRRLCCSRRVTTSP